VAEGNSVNPERWQGRPRSEAPDEPDSGTVNAGENPGVRAREGNRPLASDMDAQRRNCWDLAEWGGDRDHGRVQHLLRGGPKVGGRHKDYR